MVTAGKVVSTIKPVAVALALVLAAFTASTATV